MDEMLLNNLSSFANQVMTNGSMIMIADGSDILPYCAIALMLGFLTARIGSKKGGSFFKWFVAGTLGGIIALPVAIFKKEPVALPAFKKCPKCTGEIPIFALVCDACDYNFISGLVGNRHPMLPAPNEPLACDVSNQALAYRA
jgi:hypothetical protein